MLLSVDVCVPFVQCVKGNGRRARKDNDADDDEHEE